MVDTGIRNRAMEETAMNHCELCGKRLDMSEKSERMSQMCDSCIADNPDEFEERWAAAMEEYDEIPTRNQ